MPSNLPPIWSFDNFKEDLEKYEAKAEKKEIKFKTCPHKDVKIEDGSLKCKCGNRWYGRGIHDVYQLLKG